MDILKRLGICAIALTVLLPTVALATQPGWYIAIDGGQARYSGAAGNEAGWLSLPPTDVPPPQPNPETLVSCCTVATTASSGSTDTAYRLTVGYQFNPYFGLEASYVDLGNINAVGQGTFAFSFQCPFGSACPDLEGLGGYTGSARLRDRGWVLAVTGSWPLNPHWSLFGRAGVFDSHARLAVTTTPDSSESPANPFAANSLHESAAGWEPTYGVGVNYSPIAHWALRLGWNRYASLGDRNTTGKFSVSLASLGVVYTF